MIDTSQRKNNVLQCGKQKSGGIKVKNESSKHEEIEALNITSRSSKDAGFVRRALGVRLILEGRSIEEAAKISNYSEEAVRLHIARYEAEGLEGLFTKKAPGAKRKLTPEQEGVLYETIKTKLPRDVGLVPFANWTAPLAVKYVIAEFGVEYSERGMRNLFERLGLSYTRPTYTLAKADPQKQDDFRQEFEAVKKNCYAVK